MGVIDGDHGDLILVGPVDDGVGEAAHQSETQLLENLPLEFGRPLETSKNVLDA